MQSTQPFSGPQVPNKCHCSLLGLPNFPYHGQALRTKWERATSNCPGLCGSPTDLRCLPVWGTGCGSRPAVGWPETSASWSPLSAGPSPITRNSQNDIWEKRGFGGRPGSRATSDTGLQEAGLTFCLCNNLTALIAAPPRLHPKSPCLPELPG